MVMCVVTSPCLCLVLIKALLLRNKNWKYNCTFFIYVLHIFLYIHTGFGFYSCVANRIRTRIRIPTSWIGTEVGLKKTWLRTPLAIVTFSDPDSSPVPKFLNLGPGQKLFQIWESDCSSDSSNRRCNRKSAMFLLKQWRLYKPCRLLLLPKINNNFESGFSRIFDSGSQNTPNPVEFDPGNPDPWASQLR